MRSFAKIFSALAIALFGASAFGEDVASSEKLAQFSPDHKSIIVKAPGIDELAFGSAATSPSNEKFPLSLSDIRVRDPFILPDQGTYYLYAQGGNRKKDDNADLGVEVYR
ncbi:MAG: hypothetical protein EBS96_13600, partial [Spartobacteria bacterium]|nr:hypothetical protein [Spartobacteria bacterium]